MLKWKRIRHVALLAAVILGISSIFVYVSVQKTANNSSFSHFSSIPSGYFDPLGGQVVSLAEAQASVPFKIHLPTYTGGRDSFVQVKLFELTVYVIYAAYALPSDASRLDILDYDAILLMESPVSLGYGTLQDAEKNFRAFLDQYQAIDQSLCQVSINGYFGTAGGNVAHCVQWATETTYYRLTVNKNCPLHQLVEIAQSIPIN